MLIPFPEISPDIFSFELFGITIALRWYALAYIAGILIAWRLTLAALRRPALWPDDKPPMRSEQLEDLLTWVILGIILGGRLGYVLFYRPLYFLENPSEILMVWQGGMSFHGGFLGVIVAAWLYTMKYNIPRLKASDAIAVGVPWGGCCWGGASPTLSMANFGGAAQPICLGGRRLSGTCSPGLPPRYRGPLRPPPLTTL